MHIFETYFLFFMVSLFFVLLGWLGMAVHLLVTFKYLRKVFIALEEKMEFVDKLCVRFDLIGDDKARSIREMETRLNDRLGQMEIRLSTLISSHASENLEKTWEVREKILLLEHKRLPSVNSEARPRGRPRKNP